MRGNLALRLIPHSLTNSYKLIGWEYLADLLKVSPAMILLAVSVGWNASQKTYWFLFKHGCCKGRHVKAPPYLPLPQHALSGITRPAKKRGINTKVLILKLRANPLLNKIGWGHFTISRGIHNHIMEEIIDVLIDKGRSWKSSVESVW